MTIDHFLALLGFAFVGAMTPGPNNVMLMSSGANFGFRRTLPHITGVTLGFPVMVLLVGLGAMRLFDAVPGSYGALKIVSVVYLVYLAWRIANAAPPKDAAAEARPLTMVQAALFQWVNPKGWTMALTTITIYAIARDLPSVLWVVGCFGFVGIVSTITWTVMGKQIRRLLSGPARLRVFNRAMAALLLLSLVPVLMG